MVERWAIRWWRGRDRVAKCHKILRIYPSKKWLAQTNVSLLTGVNADFSVLSVQKILHFATLGEGRDQFLALPRPTYAHFGCFSLHKSLKWGRTIAESCVLLSK